MAKTLTFGSRREVRFGLILRFYGMYAGVNVCLFDVCLCVVYMYYVFIWVCIGVCSVCACSLDRYSKW